MKKILLIEDRDKRQQLFMESSGIVFDDYSDVLENVILESYEDIAEQLIRESFDFSRYDYVISHKSAYGKDNAVAIIILQDYCKHAHKPLVFFSGGISVNYYDNCEYELLELNSKIFYSKNLKIFLDALRKDSENILMLCYGEHWIENTVANVLEKTNLFIFDIEHYQVSPSEFKCDKDLAKILYKFYEIQEASLSEIIKFRQSLEAFFSYHPIQNISNSSVVIHHDNICALDLFNSHIKFSLSEDDVDSYMCRIIEELDEQNFEMIFIKDNLGANYRELFGIRMAYHIRLSEELGNKRFTPIVIISDFDAEQLNRFDPLAEILFSKNVFLINNAKEAIEKIQSFNIQNLTTEEYENEFLSKIKIEAPKDYLSHHSIANEWSIYRWSDLLNVETDTTKANRSKIENMLYFKYLKAIYSTKDKKSLEINKPSKKGNVLLIDDEWNKGWADIIKTVLEFEGIALDVFEYDFKDKTNFNLIVQLKFKLLREQIESADVVILDLRLVDSDHDNDDIDSYSGVKILHTIHEINAGIQVIMLTATSKSTILEKLYDKKILGYVKKEHPDDTSIDTAENINKLIRLVDKGLERKYLKKVFLIERELLALPLLQIEFSFDMEDNDKKLLEVKNTIPKIFETLDSNIPKPFVSAMLTIYKCLEIINDYYIYEQYDEIERKLKAYWRNNSKIIDSDGNASVNNKTKNILKKLGVSDDEMIRLIDEISCSRNYEIHFGEIKSFCRNKTVFKPNEEHILKWFSMIQSIIDKIRPH